VRQRIAAEVAAHAGLAMPDWVLDARVQERMSALGLRGPAAGTAYVERLSERGPGNERAALIEALRVGETRFFRHATHVQALLDVVVPALAQRLAGLPPQQRVVRAWSMGCATGEEAYTLAMILGGALDGCEVRVLGTDVSERALAIARAGVYPAAAVARVPEPWRSASFVPVRGARVQVTPALRSLVALVHHNLLDRSEPAGWEGPAAGAGFDVIWCRNVLIYFAPEARRQVVTRFARALAPHGFLFLGAAESLRSRDGFAAVRTGDAVLYRKAAPASAAVTTSRRTAGTGQRTNARGPVQTREHDALPGPAPQPMLPSMPMHAPRDRSADSHAPRTPGADSHAPRARGADSREMGQELRLSGRYESGERLARELSAAMAGGHAAVVVHLDGAAFLGEDAAAVLRRAQSAARAAGTKLQVRATRPGARRWLRRHGLTPDGHDDHGDRPGPDDHGGPGAPENSHAPARVTPRASRRGDAR
jgi:chemotaxis protein methyltransferase CheR